MNLVRLTGFYIKAFGEFMIKCSPSDLFFKAKTHPKWNKRALREPLRDKLVILAGGEKEFEAELKTTG